MNSREPHVVSQMPVGSLLALLRADPRRQTRQPDQRATYRPKMLSRVNFLHYGDALERLQQLNGQLSGPDRRKVEIISQFRNERHSPFFDEVIRSYGRAAARLVSVAALSGDVALSLNRRKVFALLGCRGFSYELYQDVTAFPYNLRSRVNLRVALVARRNLFYPPKVRRFLSRDNVNHYFVDADPAIAFALGIATRTAWYVFVMQSDLVRRGNAAIREHFRGWRRVLFAELLVRATQMVPHVYLISEYDVLNACHEDHPRPEGVPRTWRSIYRDTAREFGMCFHPLSRALNVQIYARKPPVYARSLYRFALSEDHSRRDRNEIHDHRDLL